MADDQQQFCLRWNDFQSNMVNSFKHLRDEKSFTDVTLGNVAQHTIHFKNKIHLGIPFFLNTACEGQTCKAHKMVLSACSPYFKSLLEVSFPHQGIYHIINLLYMNVCFCLFLQENPSKHPIIILKDVPFAHLQAILEFMYAGEVNVAQDQLPAFLKTAERLKVKGLAEVPPVVKKER